jgi:hypothetical protein
MKNYIGQKFGRLEVIDQYEKDCSDGCKRTFLYCKCDCSNKKEVLVNQLLKGSTVSCGCYRNEKLSLLNKKYNRYDLSGDYGVGYTFKDEEFYFDLSDYDLIKNYCWSLDSNGYVVSYSPLRRKKIELQDLILDNFDKDKDVRIDHENRIRWDDRRDNLRFVTHQQNNYNKGISSRNTSGIIGVCKAKNLWESGLKMNGVFMARKLFESFDDAVFFRLCAEKEFFGEFAPQKHLFQQYGII